MSRVIAERAEEGQARRGRGQARPRRVLRDTVTRDPRRRAHGRARQGRAGRGQPAPRGVHRQEVHQPRPAVPGPDPGGQHRPDEGGRQVRVQARLQVLDLRHLVDPPGHHPRHRRPGAHHPHPGAHDRDHQQADPHQPLPGAGARPRADARRDRREDGAAARQGPQGPQDRQGAHLARDAHRRGGRLAPRRLHRGQERHLAGRRGHLHEPGRADPQGAGDADAARGEGPAHALRHRREVRPHARRGGPGLRGHARAHPPDRGQGAAQAAPPRRARKRLKSFMESWGQARTSSPSRSLGRNGSSSWATGRSASTT